MNEREKQLAENILVVLEQLPEAKKHQLLGIAQGMDIASLSAPAEKAGKNRAGQQAV